jgi:hypothetical protein
MDRLAEIIDAASRLSPAERRRLVVELDALDQQQPADAPRESEPLAALRALSGAAHSDLTDLSTNKYAHVAAASDLER